MSIDYNCYDDKELTFEIKGNYFIEGFDLYETVSVLNDLQSIFDKAYLTITEKTRMSKNDREIYRIKAVNIRKGSLLADISIYVCGAAQLAIPILAHYSPTFLWDVTKEAFNYLRIVLGAYKQGKMVSLKADGDGNMNIIISGNNNSIVFSEKSYILASKTYDDYVDLAKKIDGENVESISLIEKNKNVEKNPIFIGTKEKEIFSTETRLEEIPTKIKGKIFRIDTHVKSGKLVVTKSEDKELEGNELNFELLNERDIEKCCKEIDNEASFVVLKKVTFDPIKAENITKSLKIVSIN